MKAGWTTIGEGDSARHVFIWAGKMFGGKTAYEMSQKHGFDKSKVEYKNGKLYRKKEEESKGELSQGEKNAIEEYVSGDGMWVNQYLRGRGDFGELSEAEKKYLNDLTSATDRPLNPQTLYRSVDAQAIFGAMSDGDYENLTEYLVYGADSFGKGAYADRLRESLKRMIDNAEGKNILEKGFMSTTKDYTVAYDWGDYTGSGKPIVLEIDVGEGARGVDVSYTDANVDEDEAQQEVLLAKGQELHVDYVGHKDGVIYVQCSVREKSAEKQKTITAEQMGLNGSVLGIKQSKAQITKANKTAQKLADYLNKSQDNTMIELYTNADIRREIKFSGKNNYASRLVVSLNDMSKNDSIASVETNLHELAHVIDRNVGGVLGHFTSRYIDRFEQIAEKYKTPEGAVKEYLENVHEEYKKIKAEEWEKFKKTEPSLKENYTEYARRWNKAYSEYTKKADEKKRNLGACGLEDIFSAMNGGGRVEGLYTYAHSEEYYSTRENKVIETFANYCAMRTTNGEAYKIFKKYMPEMEELMGEIVQNVIRRKSGV